MKLGFILDFMKKITRLSATTTENTCKNHEISTHSQIGHYFIQIYIDAPPGVPGVSKKTEGPKDQ